METDLIWMTLLVFVPSVFALGLIFFPRGWQNAMCWWSLVGTAVTLAISIAMLILFKDKVVDTRETRAAMSLDSRVLTMDANKTRGEKQGYDPDDWVSRYPWIKRFNIDYYLGVDGI